MSYTPKEPPEDIPRHIREWVEEELHEIERVLQAVEFIQLQELHVEPLRPRAGNVVLADGTDWDPGSGAGFYGYYGGSWVKLG